MRFYELTNCDGLEKSVFDCGESASGMTSFVNAVSHVRARIVTIGCRGVYTIDGHGPYCICVNLMHNIHLTGCLISEIDRPTRPPTAAVVGIH